MTGAAASQLNIKFISGITNSQVTADNVIGFKVTAEDQFGNPSASYGAFTSAVPGR